MTRAKPLALAAAMCAALSGAALAHHGWAWTADGTFVLTGAIETVRLGNPHGLLTVRADDEIWTVEVGQPWRNARAGLEDAMLRPGVEITAEGKRAADPAELRMKAEAVVIDGARFELYPGGA
jgi:hypothetical protein